MAARRGAHDRATSLRHLEVAAAVEAELLVRSPCQVKLDDARIGAPRLPTPDEIERLIRFTDPANVAVVVVATVRGGAGVVGLQVGDVDILRSTLSISALDRRRCREVCAMGPAGGAASR